jgi:hypothetical protein
MTDTLSPVTGAALTVGTRLTTADIAVLPVGSSIGLRWGDAPATATYVRTRPQAAGGWSPIQYATRHEDGPHFSDGDFSGTDWHLTGLPAAEPLVRPSEGLSMADTAAPQVEEPKWSREQMLVALSVWQAVRRAGNEHYYARLSEAGVLPERHEVVAFSNALTEDALTPWLTEVAEASVELEMCEVFDEMCRLVGLPTREDLGVERDRSFEVRGYVTVEVRVPVSTTVTARSDDDALESVSDEPGEYLDTDDIRDALRYGNYTVTDGEWEEADEA